jgi:hypothetical protein
VAAPPTLPLLPDVTIALASPEPPESLEPDAAVPST